MVHSISRLRLYSKTNRNERSSIAGKPFVCFLCKKPGHAFMNCPTGSQKCKDEMRTLLRERKFDIQAFFKQYNEQTKNSSDNSLNSKAAATSGFQSFA